MSYNKLFHKTGFTSWGGVSVHSHIKSFPYVGGLRIKYRCTETKQIWVETGSNESSMSLLLTSLNSSDWNVHYANPAWTPYNRHQEFVTWFFPRLYSSVSTTPAIFWEPAVFWGNTVMKLFVLCFAVIRSVNVDSAVLHGKPSKPARQSQQKTGKRIFMRLESPEL